MPWCDGEQRLTTRQGAGPGSDNVKIRGHVPGGGNLEIGLHQIQGASLLALQQQSLRQGPAVARFPQQQSHRNATEQHAKGSSHQQLHQGEASAATELRHGLGAGTTRC